VLRALRWRLAASITVFAVALVGIAAAAVGPVYLHAIDQALLASRLLHAPQNRLDVHVVQDTTVGLGEVDWHTATRSLAGLADDPRLFTTPVFSENAPIQWTNNLTYDSDLAAVDGLCRHVRVVAGRCLAGDDGADALVTERIAKAHGLSVGDTVRALGGGTSAPLPVRIVGIVAPIATHGTFWAPWPYFITTTSAFNNAPPRTDAFFVSHRFLDTHEGDVEQTMSVDLRLRARNVGLGDLDRLRSTLSTLQKSAAALPVPAQTSVPTVHSGLPGVLAAMHAEMSLARTLVILPAAQLVVLAIVLLYAVVSGTTAASEPEVALGRLRGRRARSILLQALGPSVVLVVLAAPIAALIAWGVVGVVAPHLLGGDVVARFPSSAVVVVVAATAASVLAAAIAARRVLVAPVGHLLRRSEATARPSIGLVLVDGAAIVLGVAGVVELVSSARLTSGSVNPLSALAVVLLGAAAGVAVVRLLPLLGRPLVRVTRDSSRVAGHLALRQIVRRPIGARVIVLLGVAVSLATFAVTMWSSAANNRDERALEQAGAHTVYYVRPARDVHDLRTAVDKADPGGNSAAAAIVQVARTTPLLAVDTARFAGVGAWARHDSAIALRMILAKLRAVPPSVVVDSRAVRISVDATTLPSSASSSLTVSLTGADHITTPLVLGPLHPGRTVFTEDVPCVLPCRVTGVALGAKAASGSRLSSASAIAATVRVAGAASTSAASWHPVAGFADTSRWRQGEPGELRLASNRGGLAITVRYSPANSYWPGAVSADAPTAVPAVVTPITASLYNDTTIHDIAGFGLDSDPLDLDGALRAVSLPTLDRNGVMVDLGVALDATHGELSPQVRWLVYADSRAPADLPARLSREGVVVTRTVRASDVAERLAHTGPAYADGLFLVAAVLGALLALGAIVLASATAARRRAYEFAALRSAGVAPGTLRRAVGIEQLVLLGTGLVVGVAAGLVGARLALPKTPAFADEHVGPPVDGRVPFGAPSVLAAVLLVVFVLACVGIALVTTRQATADRLRETV